MEDKKTILVVEDDPLNMKLFVDLLEFNGFHVLRAADGESVPEVLGEATPDLIFLDIQLPGMDGFAVLEQLRQNRRYDEVKIIALTAQVMKEEQDRIKQKGFNGYIAKPIDIKNFINIVKDIVACGNV